MRVAPDYARLDAPLALACEETRADERCLIVFVHTVASPDRQQIQKLERLGVPMPESPRRIFTATLSPEGVAELSHEPWVKRLLLSRHLRPLDEGT